MTFFSKFVDRGEVEGIISLISWKVMFYSWYIDFSIFLNFPCFSKYAIMINVGTKGRGYE